MAYNIIAENEDYTIVSDYQTIYRKSDKYQSEAQLEKELIKTLTEQGYDYLTIHTEQDLVDREVVVSLLGEGLNQLLL
jgi:type I restriction enzyme R subunit